MSQSKSHRVASHVFTLVEIMVAMALLLLMMSFLFEFILSGQRLWTASEHKLSSYDDGQIVLDVVGEDLRDLVYDDQVGRARPFYACRGYSPVTVKSNTVQLTADVYMFFTRFRSAHDTKNAGVYPIFYVYIPYDSNTSADAEKWAGRLYRIPIEPPSSNNTGSNAKVWDAFNVDFKNETSVPACMPLTTLGEKMTEDNVLMNNVHHFSLTPLCIGSSSFSGGFLNCTGKLQSVHVAMSIFSKDAINPEDWEEASSLDDKEKLMVLNERSFTKTVRVW